MIDKPTAIATAVVALGGIITGLGMGMSLPDDARPQTDLILIVHRANSVERILEAAAWGYHVAEVDVRLVNGTLIMAHDPGESGETLEAGLQAARRAGITLLLDLKADFPLPEIPNGTGVWMQSKLEGMMRACVAGGYVCYHVITNWNEFTSPVTGAHGLNVAYPILEKADVVLAHHLGLNVITHQIYDRGQVTSAQKMGVHGISTDDLRLPGRAL